MRGEHSMALAPSIVCIAHSEVNELVLVETLRVVAPRATVTTWRTGQDRPSVEPPSVVLVNFPRLLSDEQLEVMNLWRMTSGSKVLAWLIDSADNSGDELARTEPDAWISRGESVKELLVALSSVGFPVDADAA